MDFVMRVYGPENTQNFCTQDFCTSDVYDGVDACIPSLGKTDQTKRKQATRKEK